MIQKCSFCNSYEEIVYEDYAPPQEYSKALYIYICWKCAVLFDIGLDEVRRKIANLFPKMLTCATCQEKFIPRKNGQVICYSCWKNSKPKTEEVNVWRFG